MKNLNRIFNTALLLLLIIKTNKMSENLDELEATVDELQTKLDTHQEKHNSDTIFVCRIVQ